MLRNVNGKRTISNIWRCYLYMPFWMPLYKGRRHSFLILLIPDEQYVSVYLNYHLEKSLEYLLTVTRSVVAWGGSTGQIAPSEYVGTKEKKTKDKYIFVWIGLKKISMGLLHFIKALVSWGVDSEDELPPGIPSATGLPISWFRASSSASARGGAAGSPPVLRASAFFLLTE